MKVCWKYTPAMGESGPAPRHVAEALSIRSLVTLSWMQFAGCTQYSLDSVRRWARSQCWTRIP